MPTAAPTNSCWVTSSTRLMRQKRHRGRPGARCRRAVDRPMAVVAGRVLVQRCASRGTWRSRASCRRVRSNRREGRTAPRRTPRTAAAGLRAWPRHLTEDLVDFRQQPDVRRRVLARERPAATASAADPGPPRSPAMPHQTLRLLSEIRRGDEEPEHHALVALAEPPIAEAFHPERSQASSRWRSPVALGAKRPIVRSRRASKTGFAMVGVGRLPWVNAEYYP